MTTLEIKNAIKDAVARHTGYGTITDVRIDAYEAEDFVELGLKGVKLSVFGVHTTELYGDSDFDYIVLRKFEYGDWELRDWELATVKVVEV